MLGLKDIPVPNIPVSHLGQLLLPLFLITATAGQQHQATQALPRPAPLPIILHEQSDREWREAGKPADTVFVESTPGIYTAKPGTIVAVTARALRLRRDTTELLLTRRGVYKVIFDFVDHLNFRIDGAIRSRLRAAGKSADCLRAHPEIDSLYVYLTDPEDIEYAVYPSRKDSAVACANPLIKDTEYQYGTFAEPSKWQRIVSEDWNREKSALASSLQSAPMIGGWLAIMDAFGYGASNVAAVLVLSAAVLYILYAIAERLTVARATRTLTTYKLELDVLKAQREVAGSGTSTITQGKGGLAQSSDRIEWALKIIRQKPVSLRLLKRLSPWWSAAKREDIEDKWTRRFMSWRRQRSPRANRLVYIAGAALFALVILGVLGLAAFIEFFAVLIYLWAGVTGWRDIALYFLIQLVVVCLLVLCIHEFVRWKLVRRAERRARRGTV